MKRLATAAVVLCFAAGAATAQTTQPKAHTETTVKQTGPGPDSKTKTEVVIGTVTEYEPGKKLKVVGPKDQDLSFDLDEAVAVKGAFAVGERVKVTYTKMGTGQKVTIVEPYKGQ